MGGPDEFEVSEVYMWFNAEQMRPRVDLFYILSLCVDEYQTRVLIVFETYSINLSAFEWLARIRASLFSLIW